MLAAHYFRQMGIKLLWVANPTPEMIRAGTSFFSLFITLSDMNNSNSTLLNNQNAFKFYPLIHQHPKNRGSDLYLQPRLLSSVG